MKFNRVLYDHSNTFFTIRNFSEKIGEELNNTRLESIFQLRENEFSFFFQGDKSYLLQIYFDPTHTVYRINETEKSQQGGTKVFKQVSGLKITSIEPVDMERAFIICFEHTYALLFKFFGRQSNVVLFKSAEPLQTIRKPFKNDMSIKLSDYSMEKSLDKEAINKVFPNDPDFSQKLRSLVPVLTKDMAEWVSKKAHLGDPTFETLSELLDYFKAPEYYIYRLSSDKNIQTKAPLVFSLLKVESSPILWQGKNILEALDVYSRFYFPEKVFIETYKSLNSKFTEKLQKQKSAFKSISKRLRALQSEQPLREVADIIMANLHMLKLGKSEKVSLYDFYNKQEIELSLPAKESPQDYASRLYKKSAMREKEKSFQQNKLKKTEEEIGKIEKILAELNTISDLKELRNFKQKYETDKSKKEGNKKEESDIFYQYEINGFKILAGRNAKNNDKLTFKYADKNDLWFHAKDYSGSHVIIKLAGQQPPESVIEAAASIAAYYSKGKHAGLLPVVYTYRKYVRKPKGAIAGKVIHERAESILVPPELPAQQSKF